MPPVDFDVLAARAFDQIKRSLTVEALYIPKTGAPKRIRGVFDDRVQEVDPDTERVISSNIYTLGIKLSDLSAVPVKGDRVRIKRIDYLVQDSREDGVPGVSTVLILQRVVKA